MSEVESDETNTPTQPKRIRITPIRFRDEQLTDDEEKKEAEESLCDDHSVLQQCSSSWPYSLPPVVGTSSRVSPSSSYRKKAVSPLPSHLHHPSSGFHPASIGTHNPLLAKLEKVVMQQLSLLEEMKNDIRDLKKRFARMEGRDYEKQATRGKLPEGFQFPLQSSEDVERLEWDLKTDPRKKTCLECYLAFTLKHVVRGILSMLFSTELARTYNFNGLKGKKGIKNHPLILQTVQDAARKSYPEATDADMRVQISTWLACARDRENGRRERAGHLLNFLTIIIKNSNICLMVFFPSFKSTN